MTTKSKSAKSDNKSIAAGAAVEDRKDAAINEKAINDLTTEIKALTEQLTAKRQELRKLTGKDSKKEKGPGVITTILSLVTDSGKTGISKSDIHAKLVEMFPEHAPDGLMKTIAVQLPGRMSKERNIRIEKKDDRFILVK